MDATQFAALEQRLQHKKELHAELDTCLAQIRTLQRRRCTLDAQLRQLAREARDRQAREALVQAA